MWNVQSCSYLQVLNVSKSKPMKIHAFFGIFIWIAWAVALQSSGKSKVEIQCTERALTLFTGVKFSIMQHHKVKPVFFHDIPVFPLTSAELIFHRTGRDKGCIFIHFLKNFSRFNDLKVQTAFVPWAESIICTPGDVWSEMFSCEWAKLCHLLLGTKKII